MIEFGAKMAPASEGFANFLRDTVPGSRACSTTRPHADSFRRIWEALGWIMEVVLPLVGDLVGWLADHLAPVLSGWPAG
ncbi:hypothetical protein HBB16_04430 [Pseudonocardia sp. MCCB 268]|nr:hypothetical protein [Pseudonocardia cytotoxica]